MIGTSLAGYEPATVGASDAAGDGAGTNSASASDAAGDGGASLDDGATVGASDAAGGGCVAYGEDGAFQTSVGF